MTTANAFLGHQSILGTVAEGAYGYISGTTRATISDLTNAFVFESEGLAKTGNIIERNGLRGTRSHVSDDTRTGPYSVAGTLNLEPTPTDLNWWLYYILGLNPSGTHYTLGETLPSFSLGVQRSAGTTASPSVTNNKFLYYGCKINRATLSGSSGGMLKLALEIVAQAEATASTAWPSISASITGPYIFEDLAFTVNSLARQFRDFSLTVDNHLIADRFMNSLTIVNAPEGDRTVSLSTTHAWDQVNADLYDIPLAGYSGATLVSTFGGHSHTYTFGALQAPAHSPTAASRGENYLTLPWTSRKVSSTAELDVLYA